MRSHSFVAVIYRAYSIPQTPFWQKETFPACYFYLRRRFRLRVMIDFTSSLTIGGYIILRLITRVEREDV